MLVKNNNENILDDYIEYLKDKGKITKIKDTNKETNIRFSSGIIFYFLSIVSIVLVVLTLYLIGSSFINPSTDGESNAIIVIGVALLTAIVIGVTLNEKKNIKLNISYPSENQIKVNNKIFDIEKEDCCIDIIKKYEYNLRYERRDTYRPGYHTAKYFLNFKGNRMSKSFPVTNGTEEQIRDLIYNFEYEISDFKKQKSEFIKNAQNTLEELYDKGSVSQDTLNKLYENKDRNE